MRLVGARVYGVRYTYNNIKSSRRLSEENIITVVKNSWVGRVINI